MQKSKYLIYKKGNLGYLKSFNSVKQNGQLGGFTGLLEIGPVLLPDKLIASADNEEDCEKFINNLDDQGTFYWIKGIVKNTSIEP